MLKSNCAHNQVKRYGNIMLGITRCLPRFLSSTIKTMGTRSNEHHIRAQAATSIAEKLKVSVISGPLKIVETGADPEKGEVNFDTYKKFERNCKEAKPEDNAAAAKIAKEAYYGAY